MGQSIGHLKGVPPTTPFQEIGFRRYYDHTLAYPDFKEASKSRHKHRMYLGLLSNAPYPSSVIYHYRERLFDMIVDLCVRVGKEPPPLDALMPPIQGDPFATEEVIGILSFPVFGKKH